MERHHVLYLSAIGLLILSAGLPGATIHTEPEEKVYWWGAVQSESTHWFDTENLPDHGNFWLASMFLQFGALLMIATILAAGFFAIRKKTGNAPVILASVAIVATAALLAGVHLLYESINEVVASDGGTPPGRGLAPGAWILGALAIGSALAGWRLENKVPAQQSNQPA